MVKENYDQRFHSASRSVRAFECAGLFVPPAGAPHPLNANFVIVPQLCTVHVKRRTFWQWLTRKPRTFIVRVTYLPVDVAKRLERDGLALVDGEPVYASWLE